MSMNETTIETCTRTWNPELGCRRNCHYCVDPDTDILMSDLSVKKIKDTRVGDEIVGFTDDRATNRVIRAVILKKWATQKIAYKITLGGFVKLYGSFEPRFFPERLIGPRRDLKPQVVFVVNMGDLWGDWVDATWIHKILEACCAAPWHVYQFYTKGPARYNPPFSCESGAA